MKRSTWLHLRIPFSVYLLPIFCFATSQARRDDVGKALLIAAILHLLAYPASQGFSSYCAQSRAPRGGAAAVTGTVFSSDPGEFMVAVAA